MSEMRVTSHRELPETHEFRQQWNGLVAAMECPEVFYTWEWARAAWHAYGATLRLLLFAGYRNENLCGIAALAVDEGGAVTFLAASTADYCDFVSAPADRAEFVGLVMRELRGMGIAELRLANLPADSTSASALRAVARQSGYSIFTRPAYLCAQITLKSEEDRAQIARSARRNSKRTRKALAEMGGVTVDHSGTWEKFTAEFPGLATASVARMLGGGRSSNLVARERRVFLEELAKLLSEQGTLALSTLKLGGRTIAWHYGFQYAGVWFWYLPVFDRELQHLRPGPGSCLFYEILLEASENPEIHTVDLGLGDEGYKDRYAKGGRHTLYVTVSRSKARLAREACRHQVASWLGRSPAVETWARRLLARASAERTRIIEQGVLGASRHYLSRARRAFFCDAEVIFFESSAGSLLQFANNLEIRPISINLLATAAMEYEKEAETREYLFRCASRLRSAGTEGYALVTGGDMPVHFCWVSPFEGFRIAELGCVLPKPPARSVVLFDCWTPPSLRGRGYYGQCAAQVAERVLEREQRPWIFSAATNRSSMRGLEGSGFVKRFSVMRKKRWLLDGISVSEAGKGGGPVLDLYPAA